MGEVKIKTVHLWNLATNRGSSWGLCIKLQVRRRHASFCKGGFVEERSRLVAQPPFLLAEKIIRGCDMVVLVHLKAFRSIISGKPKSIKLFHDFLLNFRHVVFRARKLHRHRCIWNLPEPTRLLHSRQRDASFWRCRQQL
jgi:hypothetical protein